MSTDPRSRIWKPLDPSKWQIRLLYLESCPDEHGPLRGKLVVASLLHHPRYIAISHAWGRPQGSVSLFINDVRWPVTTSVARCLEAFRFRDENQAYWIDAICVNQFDLEERAQQVKLMQHIFSTAIGVRVWLGKGGRWMRNSCKLINRLGGGEDHQSVIQSARDLAKLSYFTEGDWWERLWVLQELALARDVVFTCGESDVKLETLEKYRDKFLLDRRKSAYYASLEDDERIALQRSFDQLGQLVEARRLLNTARLKTPKQNAAHLIKLLGNSRLKRASDPKDRVYGFLGICTALFGQDFMEPDYTAALVVVYTTFASALISLSGSLVILRQASQFHNTIAGLPSWVPDWTSNFDYETRIFNHWYVRERVHPVFAAATPARANVHGDSGTSSTILLSGVIVGVIRDIGGICERFDDKESNRKNVHIPSVLEQWDTAYLTWSRNSHEPGRGPPFEYDRGLFARTVFRDTQLADQNAGNGRGAGAVQALEDARADLRKKQSEMYASDNGLRLACAVRGSLFFVSTTGLPGLGPADTQPGDLLAVLHGGDVPYVLRRSTDRSRRDLYTLVGECYVVGAMEGEMVPLDKKNLEEVWLE